MDIVVASSVKPDEVSMSNVEASMSIATSLVLPISIPLGLRLMLIHQKRQYQYHQQ